MRPLTSRPENGSRPRLRSLVVPTVAAFVVGIACSQVASLWACGQGGNWDGASTLDLAIPTPAQAYLNPDLSDDMRRAALMRWLQDSAAVIRAGNEDHPLAKEWEKVRARLQQLMREGD
jgi:hypothetical protein